MKAGLLDSFLDAHIPSPHMHLWVPRKLEVADEREQGALYSVAPWRQPADMAIWR